MNASKCQFNFCFTIQLLIVMSYLRMWSRAHTWLGAGAGVSRERSLGPRAFISVTGHAGEPRWPLKATQLCAGPMESWLPPWGGRHIHIKQPSGVTRS